jgi:hypothetical protein
VEFDVLLRGDDVNQALKESGCALLTPLQVEGELHTSIGELNELSRFWASLPRDAYLRDGGRYRYRRHSCFIQDLARGELEQVPHRAHWQSTDYNALHGGMERWFEPIDPVVTNSAAWRKFVTALGSTFARAQPVKRWYIEAHQFRIDTTEGIGRPTPEGAHRDGVDFVAVSLVKRTDVRGGETRVFEAQGTAGLRFTMVEPWTTLLLDDARVIHETTPIQPEGEDGVRDTLVLTYRTEGFQSPAGS